MGELIQFPVRRQDEVTTMLWPELAATGTEGASTAHHADVFQIRPEYITDIDDIRAQARAEAERIVEHNRQQLRDGHFESVPLDVDAVNTARKVAEVKRQYGDGSPEHIFARQGLRLDCARKWAEAFRKNSWEYFEPIEQIHDPETDELYAHGLSVDAMLYNGLSPMAEREETSRRVNDFVRHATHKALLCAPQADEIAAFNISPCTDWALEAFERNPNGAHGGYAPEIEKLMVSYDSFDAAKGKVYHEQMAIAGTYITTEVIIEALRVFEATRAVSMTKTEIHNTVGQVSIDAVSGALDIVKLLDQIATEQSGVNVFLGEAVPDSYIKDYTRVYREAETRRVQQEDLAEELTCYVEGLHEQGIDPALATVMVERYIQQEMLKIAKQDPELAEVIFNKETARGFYEVQMLERQGMMAQADALRLQVEQTAPQTSSCGAGSCGLEGVDKDSRPGKELAKLTQAEDGDEIVKDTERACKCGKKEVVYAYSQSKVNKKCMGCGAFESKKTTPKKAA